MILCCKDIEELALIFTAGNSVRSHGSQHGYYSKSGLQYFGFRVLKDKQLVKVKLQTRAVLTI